MKKIISEYIHPAQFLIGEKSNVFKHGDPPDGCAGCCYKARTKSGSDWCILHNWCEPVGGCRYENIENLLCNAAIMKQFNNHLFEY